MDYAISDIHGHYSLLMKLLDKIKFSSKDRLFVLGDMIEKGNESIKVLDFLSKTQNAISILGNHDHFFLNYFWSLTQGLAEYDDLVFISKEFFPKDEGILTLEIVSWLENLPYFVEEDKFICVHAGAPLDENGRIMPLDDVTIEYFLYDRRFKENSNVSPDQKCVLFGHTPTRHLTNKDEIIVYPKNGLIPDRIENVQKIHLDTGVFLSGRLGLIRLDDLQTFYVQE